MATVSFPRSNTSSRVGPRWRRRFAVALRRYNIFAIVEVATLIALLAMIWTTYYTFASAPPDGQLLPSRRVASLLILTLLPAMALLVLAGRRFAIRRAAGGTARLHVRLVFLFSLIAAVPTLLVATFAAFLFQSGADFWFSDNSRGLMEDANALARDYYVENQLEMADETRTMAGDLRFYFERGTLTDADFADFYRYQAQGRDLNESAILQELDDGSMRTAAMLDLREGNEPQSLDAEIFAKLRAGEPVVVQSSATRIEAISAIDRDSGIFLYNARNSEAGSFNSFERAKSISSAYETLTRRARAMQLRFNLALFFVSLGLVGLAVWFALRFADRQVEPLSDLVVAARKVGAGNFALRVDGRTGPDEIGLLNRAFNRMTAQLEKQNDALLGANRELDERREFIEAVLESITAGIISLDRNGQVQLINSSAHALLEAEPSAPNVGKPLSELAPAIAAMVAGGISAGVVTHARGQDLLTLAVKIAAAPDGTVITFEDITRQLLDQRQAAWSDVARRIAHEIKNPLTPIQLATERLKRRYGKQIEDDDQLFGELTDTIVRQVGELRTMVDEFSSFARLPKPVFRQEDARDLVRQAVFLQEVAHPDVKYSVQSDPANEASISCDRHQFGQAMTNVLKNACEAVEARAVNETSDYTGRITVTVAQNPTHLSVMVEDNGIGLPSDRDRIVEPYVTTREKGTGLGLAIVNKIVEEHGGDMGFSTASDGGTRVTLRFSRDPAHLSEAAA
ncbi:Histidine kinase [Alteripontixanthobacter maritimus]|uniref:histidine kinase n=1 Tax=Alteripontixanthobacter maritimus TaxID=2161824 RepID=A0A369Q5H4_9SPHN|nr:ATP-binding protein [Alteripontixanthobacter maritimus]RDC59974.1 Histidine kinase [Alteripontixanthobacter maritimus]